MKAKLVKILLDHDVVFTKEDPNFVNTKGYTLSGFSVMSQRVYGDSKEEILEKMYKIHKRQLKVIKKYNALPYRVDFIEDILKGKNILLNKKYKVRCTKFTNEYHLVTHEASGKEWLHEIWLNEYTYIDWEDMFKGNYYRNFKEIDWSFWKKHEKLVNQWESELKEKTNEATS